MNDILDNILADVELTLTDDYKRAFILAGCNPACHNCRKTIPVGSKFKLAYVESYKSSKNPHVSHDKTGNDEMLCSECTVDMLIARRHKKHEKHEKDLKDPGYLYEIRNVGYTRKHNRDAK